MLYCLSSGEPAPSNVEEDLMKAEMIGAEAQETFVQGRLIEKMACFPSPMITKRELKTFVNLAKTTKITSKSHKSKQITAERNVFVQLVLFALDHDIYMSKVHEGR